MRFVSTRRSSPAVSLGEAIRRGAAPDGGLYLPEVAPAIEPDVLEADQPLAPFAGRFLRPFFDGDPLARSLPAICDEAFNFPVPLVAPDPGRSNLHVLELFHGPTGAFKDFGARFLMACFDRLGVQTPLTVLAATSGDTGGAVGCAAEGRRSTRAIILFPKGRISAFQEVQLTCWRSPVEAIEVRGDFDDCQRLVKAAFADAELSSRHNLTSANSINIARLLPQTAFAAHAAQRIFATTGVRPGFVVPTGNLGHGFAVLLARCVGAPVGPVVLATNANPTLKQWWTSGEYRPQRTIATIANAMDVGNPSNFERLAALSDAERDVRVELVGDDAIKARIRADHAAFGYIWCPHSATAAEAHARLPRGEQDARPWIVAATAHPYKFADRIEPIIGEAVAPTPALASINGRTTRKLTIDADLDALAGALETHGLQGEPAAA